MNSEDGERERISPWPERLLSAGLILGLAAMFLPWWTYNEHNCFFGGPCPVTHGAVSGLRNWAVLFDLAWVAAALLLFMRTAGARVVRDFDLSVADWFVYFVAAGVMDLGILAMWDRTLWELPPFARVRFDYTMSYGLAAAVVASLLVLAGSLALRRETTLPGG